MFADFEALKDWQYWRIRGGDRLSRTRREIRQCYKYISNGSLDSYKRVFYFSLRVDCTGECVVLPVAIPCCCTNKQPSRERAGGPRGCHPTLHRLNKHLKHSNRARMTLYDGLGVKGYFGKMSFCLISEKVILFATVHYSPKIRDKISTLSRPGGSRSQ